MTAAATVPEPWRGPPPLRPCEGQDRRELAYRFFFLEGQVGLGDDPEQALVWIDNREGADAVAVQQPYQLLEAGGGCHADHWGGHHVADGAVHGGPSSALGGPVRPGIHFRSA